MKIDLHHLNYEETRYKVIHFIEEHWGDKSELEIMTGSSKERQETVIGILREYNLDYQIDVVCIPNNKGCIVAWMD